MKHLQYIDKIKVKTQAIAISKFDCHIFGLTKLNLVWSFITLIFFTAKDLIRGLLKTVPEERLSIEDVMRNKWVAVSHLFCYFYIISLFTLLSAFLVWSLSHYWVTLLQKVVRMKRW